MVFLSKNRWTYIDTDAPKYYTGHTINLGGQAGVLVLSLFGIAYCAWINKIRAQGKHDHRLEGLTAEEEIKLGNRHPRFHYMT